MTLPRRSALVAAFLTFTLSVSQSFSVANAQTLQIPTGAINEAAASMRSGDRERVAAARQALLSQLAGKDRAFLLAYAKAVSTALRPIADTNDSHAKLNVAIVIQRLADQTGSVEMNDLIAKLIRDPSPAIATYGIRSLGAVLPRTMIDPQQAANNQLVPAVLDALKRHPDSEAIASEAYLRMTTLLLDRSAVELLGQQGVAQATAKTIDAVHLVMELRLAEFGDGKVPEPGAEQWAVSFLGRQTTWAAATKEQQTRTLRLLLQLLDASAAEMDAVPAANQMGPGRDRLNALRAVVKGAGQSLSVISELLGKAELKPSLDVIKELGGGSPIAAYKQAIQAVKNDFVRTFPELKDSVSAPRATTQPSAS